MSKRVTYVWHCDTCGDELDRGCMVSLHLPNGTFDFCPDKDCKEKRPEWMHNKGQSDGGKP